jgi:hypothetical protein
LLPNTLIDLAFQYFDIPDEGFYRNMPCTTKFNIYVILEYKNVYSTCEAVRCCTYDLLLKSTKIHQSVSYKIAMLLNYCNT